MKFPAAVLFALGVIGVVNGHEVYERHGKVVEHYEEVFEVHDGRLDSPSVKEEDQASVLNSRKLRSSNHAEAEKGSDPRELHDTRTKKVRKSYYHMRTAPEYSPRAGLVTDASFRKFQPMTTDKLQLVVKAAEYSNDVYGLENKGKENFFFSMNNITIHTAHGGVDRFAQHADEHFCWVIFAGTDEAGDFHKNLNIQPHELEDTGGCKVHRGFYRNYAGMGNDGDEKLFEPMITEFLSSDECKKKQVVFTGHSLGAASAVVGSIIWADMNPITISFGQPAILTDGKGPCKINEDNVWRFINSENGSHFGMITFDLVPSAAKVCTHVGGYIVLPPGDEDGGVNPDQDSVVFIPKEHTDPYYSAAYWDVGAHYMVNYARKLQKFAKSIGFNNLDTSGWIDKTRCYFNRECASFNEETGDGGCIDGFCTDGSLGTNCNTDKQCKSDRCAKTSVTASSCVAKLEKGKRCFGHPDCISGTCNWSYHCD